MEPLEKLRSRLTYANVMATFAVFLVLGGGTAFAATRLAAKSVGTKQLKKGAVTPAKLSTSARQALAGAPGARGIAGVDGPRGPKGETGVPGSPVTGQPAAIDAKAPEQPLPSGGSFFALGGRTSWTAPSEPAGLLIASLEVTVATNTADQEEECLPQVEVFDNGEMVKRLSAGVSGVYGGNPTPTKYSATSAPTPIDMLGSQVTRTITARYSAGATADCAPGSQIDGLRIIVQPLG